VGIVQDLMITDNPDLLRSDRVVLDAMGLSDEKIKEYFEKMNELEFWCYLGKSLWT
jgi:hypothetical protein